MISRGGLMLAGSVPTGWNPADKLASITLTQQDMTLAHDATADSWASARSLRALGAAKWYWETRMIGTGGLVMAGITQAAEGLSYAGSTANGWGYGSGGLVTNNGATVATFGSYVAGDWCRYALDLLTRKFWVSKVGAAWNGGAGADPVTNVGGFSVAASGSYYPTGSSFSNGQAVYLNLGLLAPFQSASPVGFIGPDLA